ncbi:hypothetical protein SeMB42_g07255 [Synchytrium endobioticum]|uniref:Uncharacterized protein n=1 Tax=Synchytrium endobioticum TaxID=286115 RepID=A0A507C743_9FUNG|nr:hypothetical protein SeMB42_g07255 [Synchytrium endobioticum]
MPIASRYHRHHGPAQTALSADGTNNAKALNKTTTCNNVGTSGSPVAGLPSSAAVIMSQPSRNKNDGALSFIDFMWTT